MADKRIEITIKVMDSYLTTESLTTLITVSDGIAASEYAALRDYVRSAEDEIRARSAQVAAV